MNRHAYAAAQALTLEQEEMLSDSVTGLSAGQKHLSCKYFYDEAGSRIFDEITKLPEYYPTRTEAAIMRRYGRKIASAIGNDAVLVEYGSGSSIKTRILLDELPHLAAYVPVDISSEYLFQVADRLRHDYPRIEVHPLVADFTEPFELPPDITSKGRVTSYFPGSTIGNFTRPDAVRILSQMASLSGPDGSVLVGVDLLKSRDVLLAAYNDAQGVTARFNLNLLNRLNTELDADFDLSQFRHEAIFNDRESRIEMHLVAERDQAACLGGQLFQFEEGESILTEYSHKYSLAAFSDLAAAAGLTAKQIWTDDECLFSVQLLSTKSHLR